MSVEVIAEHLDTLIKIPIKDQDPATLKQLQDYRKQLADEFYHKTGDRFDTPHERKMVIFGPLSKLHQYFGYKEIKKPFPPGKAKKVTSVEDRIANCKSFLDFLSTSKNLSPEGMIALSNVWGEP